MPNFRLKDTFDLRGINMSRDEDEETSMSSIVELSKMEELRMSQSFRAIKGPSTDLSSQIDRLTSTNKTVSWNSEGLVTKTSTLEGVHVISPSTRESTPDSVIHSGQRHIRNNMATPFQHPVSVPQSTDIRETMRGHLQSKEGGATNLPDPIPPKEDFHDEKIYQDEPKGGPCWWRGIVFITIVAILVAGIVAIIVYIRPPKPIAQGAVVHDPITHKECNDRTLNLGDKLNFTCQIDTAHPDRRIFTSAVGVRVESPNMPLVPENFNGTYASNKGIRTWTITGPNVTCNSLGTYKINFINNDSDTVGQLEVNVTVIAPQPETSLRQKQNGTTNETYFELKCSLQNDCFNLVPSFIGLIGGREKNLNEFRSCNVNLDPQNGYSTMCTGQYSEAVIAQFSYLNCRLKSGKRVLNKEFEMPNCTNHCVDTSARPYNCSLKSDYRVALDTCNTNIIQRQRCFDEGRSIFAYPVCPNQAKTCSQELQVTHCRLAWCRVRNKYRSELRKEEIPGKVLCGDNFQEIIPTTPLPTIPPTSPRTVSPDSTTETSVA